MSARARPKYKLSYGKPAWAAELAILYSILVLLYSILVLFLGETYLDLLYFSIIIRGYYIPSVVIYFPASNIFPDFLSKRLII